MKNKWSNLKLRVLLPNIMFFFEDGVNQLLQERIRVTVSAIIISKEHDASVSLLFLKSTTIKASSYPAHRKHELQPQRMILWVSILTPSAPTTTSHRFPFRSSLSPTLRVISMRGGGGWIIAFFIQVHLGQSVTVLSVLCDLSIYLLSQTSFKSFLHLRVIHSNLFMKILDVTLTKDQNYYYLFICVCVCVSADHDADRYVLNTTNITKRLENQGSTTAYIWFLFFLTH